MTNLHSIMPVTQAKENIADPTASKAHIGAFSHAISCHTVSVKQDTKAKTHDSLNDGQDKLSLFLTNSIFTVGGKSNFREHDQSQPDGSSQSAILPVNDFGTSEPLSAPSSIMTAELSDTIKAMMLNGSLSHNAEIHVSFNNSQSVLTEMTVLKNESGQMTLNISAPAGDLKFIQSQLNLLRKQLTDSGLDIDNISLSADDSDLLPVARDDGKRQ